jgi:hypothetical protein
MERSVDYTVLIKPMEINFADIYDFWFLPVPLGENRLDFGMLPTYPTISSWPAV